MFCLRLARRIVAQAVGERVDQPERPLGAADVAERRRVGGKQLEDRDRIRARPFASVHALYQPTEPEAPGGPAPSSCEMWTDRVGARGA